MKKCFRFFPPILLTTFINWLFLKMFHTFFFAFLEPWEYSEFSKLVLFTLTHSFWWYMLYEFRRCDTHYTKHKEKFLLKEEIISFLCGEAKYLAIMYLLYIMLIETYIFLPQDSFIYAVLAYGNNMTCPLAYIIDSYVLRVVYGVFSVMVIATALMALRSYVIYEEYLKPRKRGEN